MLDAAHGKGTCPASDTQGIDFGGMEPEHPCKPNAQGQGRRRVHRTVFAHFVQCPRAVVAAARSRHC